jgi:hypothetical protein
MADGPPAGGVRGTTNECCYAAAKGRPWAAVCTHTFHHKHGGCAGYTLSLLSPQAQHRLPPTQQRIITSAPTSMHASIEARARNHTETISCAHLARGPRPSGCTDWSSSRCPPGRRHCGPSTSRDFRSRSRTYGISPRRWCLRLHLKAVTELLSARSTLLETASSSAMRTLFPSLEIHLLHVHALPRFTSNPFASLPLLPFYSVLQEPVLKDASGFYTSL